MLLVDTSCWIQLLRRKGRSDVQARVQSLLRRGEAAWCDMVRLELWNGAGGDQDMKLLEDLERYVPSLEVNQAVWHLSIELTQRLRGGGVTVPAADIVIKACAVIHHVDVESLDAHFEILAKYC